MSLAHFSIIPFFDHSLKDIKNQPKKPFLTILTNKTKKMYLPILQIRLKQIYRAGSGLGLFSSFVAIGLVFFLWMALFTYISQSDWTQWITAAYLVSILSIHIRRTDKQFMEVNIENFRSIFFFEYILLALPLLVCLFYFQFFGLASLSIVCLAAIPFLGILFRING